MAFTCRLAPELQARAVDYARGLGLPLSSLVSIALDAYLKAHAGPSEGAEPAALPDPAAKRQKRVAAPPDPLAGLSPAQRLAETKRLERIARLKKEGR